MKKFLVILMAAAFISCGGNEAENSTGTDTAQDGTANDNATGVNRPFQDSISPLPDSGDRKPDVYQNNDTTSPR